MQQQEIKSLLDRYDRGECTPEEKLQVELWYFQQASTSDWELPEAEIEPARLRIWNQLNNRIDGVAPQSGKVRRLWSRIAAAAAILIAVSAGIYFTQNKTLENTPELVNDVAPGKNRATLTLAGGKIISLSEAKTGVVINSNKLTYSDGSLVRYSSGSHFSGSTKVDQKNTGPVGVSSLGAQVLTAATPKGGTYQIVLPDGSKVWLNAASTIKFPSTFSGLVSRSVELAGEAYFEIFRNKSQPFVVNTKNLEIKVLGTHFNVNSYAYEDAVRTTLVEGSVQVTPLQEPEKKTLLKPGQQAVASKQFLKIVPVDVEVATAWKNGKFLFREEKLESILNRIAYWYDVEIVYQGKKPNMLMSGVIERKRKLSSILQLIELTTKVKFRIEGRKVYVMN